MNRVKKIPPRILLLLPFILLLTAFLTDKLFYIGDLEDYFLRTASFLNYEHKEELFHELDQYLHGKHKKKVMVIFGNSRTMTFDPSYIARNYPDWTLFNFSVPGGNADYFYYCMTRFEELDLHPDILIVALSPQGFNSAPAITMDETMINGLPPGFVIKNLIHFSVRDLGNYAAKKLFWNYQYRPKLSIVLRKLEHNGAHLKGFRSFRRETPILLRRNLGSTPLALRPEQNREKVAATARDTWRAFFVPFRPAENEFYFTECLLDVAARMNIRTKIIWAKVGPELRRLKNEKIVRHTAAGKGLTVRQMWAPRIERLGRKYNAEFLDMNYGRSIRCDRFYDSSHLAGTCFGEFTDYLMTAAGE